MATVAMQFAQIYTPSKPPPIYPNQLREKHLQHRPSDTAIAAVAHSTLNIQGCSSSFISSNVQSHSDYLPPLTSVRKPSTKHVQPKYISLHVEKLVPKTTSGTNLGLGDLSCINLEQPLVIEDDKSGTRCSNVEDKSTTSVNIRPTGSDRTQSLRGVDLAHDLTSESSVPTVSAPNIWYHVEDTRDVEENEVVPSLELVEQESFTTFAHDDLDLLRHNSPLSADKSGQDNNGWDDIAAAELEKEVDVFYVTQEKSLSTSPACSPHSPHSFEPSNYPNNRHSESNVAYRGLEGWQGDSEPNTHTSNVSNKLEQQDSEIEVEVIREMQQVKGITAREMPQEKNGELNELAMDGPLESPAEDELMMEETWKEEGVDDVNISEDESSYHSTDDEDEEDEDIRIVKRQKRPSESIISKSAINHTTPGVKSARDYISSSPMPIEIDNIRPQAKEPSPTHHKQCHTMRPSRSPSATSESVSAAEYQELPMHGFLKTVRIGNQTSFHLEFRLTNAPEHFELSLSSETLGARTATLAQPQMPRNAAAHSKTRTSEQPAKRDRWTEVEEATVVRMKEEESRSWKEISAALPFRKLGAIQVRYCTILKNRTPKSKKRRRV